MSKNALVDALVLNNTSKKALFDYDSNTYSYKTGNAVMDYALGFRVNVYDANSQIVDSYASTGIQAGSQVCAIGKPSTGKTTWAVKTASIITRGLPNAFTMHFDLEQAQNYTRIMNLTGFTVHDIEEEKKYILKQGFYSIGDIKSAIMQIYMEKINNPKLYQYDTGKLDEFGKPVVLYVPTVVIIDSIPALATDVNLNEKKDRLKVEEVSSQTDRMRVTGEISRFYTEIMPYQKEANIILISINQIKPKSQIGIMPSPSELLYLGQDESLPGGKAPQYYASILLKFVAIGGEKFTPEDDGFDGFGSKIWVIKCRTNTNGKTIHMIYDKYRGFDALRTCVAYAKDLGLISGNRNGYYFNNLENGKEHKFTQKDMRKNFREDTELYTMLYDSIIPILDKELVLLNEEDTNVPDAELNY